MKKYSVTNLMKYILFIFFNVNIICLQQIHGFPVTLSVNDLNGTNGFSVSGKAQEDHSGRSVKRAGDVNGDGVDDFIIGANGVKYNNFTNCGQAYVVFGTVNGFPADLKLSTLNGVNGFAITPVNSGSNLFFGTAVSGAGDVNGDGFDDVIIASPDVVTSIPGSGKAYVIFGKLNGFPANFDASQLNGVNGFMVVYSLNNNPFGDLFGESVSSAGDINKDGFADIIIGAPSYCNNPNLLYDGRGYIIFGKSNGFSATFNVNSLNGGNGFTVTGYHDDDISYEDIAAYHVRSLGDVNGDKVDDIIISASNDGQIEIGHCYVVFGKQNEFPSNIDLQNLNGTDGFIIHGEDYEDGAGTAVGGAGDVNGDGINDILVSVYGFISGGQQVGKACVIFGQPNFPADFYLNSLNGANGFAMIGELGVAQAFGYNELSGIGDINADGFGDIIASAAIAEPNNKAYVIFGTNTFPASIQVGTLNGNNGFIVTSKDSSVDNFGFSQNRAGDVNGDGVDDFIIGASHQAPQNIANAGQSYVIFGEDSVIGDVNDDKQVDLILQQPGIFTPYPTVSAALMSNGFYLGLKKPLVLLSSSESVVAVNDFNLDGKTDLLTQNGSTVNLRKGPTYAISTTFTISATHNIVASANLVGNQVKGKRGYPDLIARSTFPITPANYYIYTNFGNGSFSSSSFFYSSKGSSTNDNWLSGAGRFINAEGPVLPNQYADVLIHKTWQVSDPVYARKVSDVKDGYNEQAIAFLPDSSVAGTGNFKKSTKMSEIISINNTTKKVYIGKLQVYSGYTLNSNERVVGPK